MTNIHFIMNPTAGNGKTCVTKELLLSSFSTEHYTLTFKETKYKKHASFLTQDSIQEGADIVVACGGDGTINEVASCLVNTSVKLGVIPMGSGNGLASHLHIPKNIEKAIAKLKAEKTLRIDVGSMNDTYFFSNTGIGFDAEVMANYTKIEGKPFYSYVKAVFKTIKTYKTPKGFTLNLEDRNHSLEPFMIFISNSNQMGYNFSLTRKASLTDGYLDMIIIKKLTKFKLMLLGVLFLFKKEHLLKEVEYKRIKKLTIAHPLKQLHAQQDGEYSILKIPNINIHILNNALQVIT